MVSSADSYLMEKGIPGLYEKEVTNPLLTAAQQKALDTWN
jgi:hypothetical protein